MARPLRIEFEGAFYHITARGNARGNIVSNDRDREKFIDLLGDVCERFNWACYAYCLMDNHYHLLIETPDANLSLGMRQLNGCYTQYYNRRHRRVGHLFQGRFLGILVEKDTYLQELCRYIVLNPVRARMVADVEEWRWSSYSDAMGRRESPAWLHVNWQLSYFGKSLQQARKNYAAFVMEGLGRDSPLKAVRQQIYLGSEEFVESAQKRIDANDALDEVPRIQTRAVAKSLDFYREKYSDRGEAMIQSYRSGGYTMRQIAEYYGVHYSTVSRLIKFGGRDATGKT